MSKLYTRAIVETASNFQLYKAIGDGKAIQSKSGGLTEYFIRLANVVKHVPAAAPPIPCLPRKREPLLPGKNWNFSWWLLFLHRRCAQSEQNCLISNFQLLRIIKWARSTTPAPQKQGSTFYIDLTRAAFSKTTLVCNTELRTSSNSATTTPTTIIMYFPLAK